MKDDLISRQAAIDALMVRDKELRNINWYDKPYEEGECRGIDEALAIVSNLPSAYPQRWIPCSERLPEESGLYIVTNVGRWVEPVGTRYYNIRADGNFWSGHPGNTVVAWMPLPESYKEEKND